MTDAMLFGKLAGADVFEPIFGFNDWVTDGTMASNHPAATNWTNRTQSFASIVSTSTCNYRLKLLMPADTAGREA